MRNWEKIGNEKWQTGNSNWEMGIGNSIFGGTCMDGSWIGDCVVGRVVEWLGGWRGMARKVAGGALSDGQVFDLKIFKNLFVKSLFKEKS